MPFKKIQIFMNPDSFKDEHLLFQLNNAFAAFEIPWKVNSARISLLKIKKLLLGSDLVMVYGGDGTVSKVAQALVGTMVPLSIIPGGTANIIAKELGIPLDISLATQLPINDYEVKVIDTGTMNSIPFVMRVNFGIMAKMISEASKGLKTSIGQLAYGITAFQNIQTVVPQVFLLTIDGVKYEKRGVALTVTNIGNIGMQGFAIVPGISNDDGLFDVLLMEEASTLNLIKYAGATLLNLDSEVITHWKGKDIRIELEKEDTFICDDTELIAKRIAIQIYPKSLHVLVPKNHKLNLGNENA